MRLPRMTSGEPALMKAWNELVAIIEPALLGPDVCPPLAVLDRTIYLTEDLGIYHFIVTEEIGPYASGEMGKGKAKHVNVGGTSGRLLSAGVGADFEIHNNTPAKIAVGTRGLYAEVDGLPQVIQAWCQS